MVEKGLVGKRRGRTEEGFERGEGKREKLIQCYRPCEAWNNKIRVRDVSETLDVFCYISRLES